MIPLFWLVPTASFLALSFACYFYWQMKRESEGTETMRRIALHVRKGAAAYLKQQYKIVAIVFVVIASLLAMLSYGLHLQNGWVPFAFLTGGFYSALAGFFGMKTATYASARTAHAAEISMDRGLRIAFRSGAVMGLTVVGLCLLDYTFWYLILTKFVNIGEEQKMVVLSTTMVTFGMGASLQALFARVGGGIFTKAADVGADIVGKVEAGIPEDDPRNPAVIADNVGDNVGDVAGMGADLYESFYGSILASASLGALAFMGKGVMQASATLAPVLIAAVGTILSIVGVFFVRIKPKANTQDLLNALGRGVIVSSVLIVVFSYFLLKYLNIDNFVGIWGAIVSGLITGLIIAKASEYYTSHTYRPTQRVAEQAKVSGATVIISGIGEGMTSVAIPVTAVVIGTMLAYGFASGFNPANVALGLYGIGIAAVGMLSTLGITLATDAYGPIADNAGGNAEMSHLDPKVRQRTDALDAIGNTTAATGKGFAIGSAALTALALLAAYVQELKIDLERIGVKVIEVSGASRALADASINDLMSYFNVNLLNPKVLMGLFLGAMMTFVFCGLAINAVGRAASKMVDEVRRQFKTIHGIMEGKAEPDYARCVRISTTAAQKEMMIPALLSITVPIVVGMLLGVPGVIGLLSGTLCCGFVLAIFMANSGGTWDNAKKYIEEGHFGGKGSPAHKAAVTGDTVGDPFKDTAGPSLNILIKLMSIASIVAAGITLSYHL